MKVKAIKMNLKNLAKSVKSNLDARKTKNCSEEEIEIDLVQGIIIPIDRETLCLKGSSNLHLYSPISVNGWHIDAWDDCHKRANKPIFKLSVAFNQILLYLVFFQ